MDENKLPYDGSEPSDPEAPPAFRQTARLSQHISFLRDFFRAYKEFDHRQLDALELLIGQLYRERGFSDQTGFDALAPEDFPILSDLYSLMEREYKSCGQERDRLYTPELLRELLLGLHSICVGGGERLLQRRYQSDLPPFSGAGSQGGAPGRQERPELP